VALILVVVLALCGAAHGSARAPHCAASATLTVTPTQPGHWSAPCRGDITLHVRVNGHDLTIGDVSNHGITAMVYGEGTVVRTDERGGTIEVLAQTVRPRVRVRVWFTRT
jgi:hypothetical protein